MNNKATNLPQRKTTLKWNINGELSSIDMARIINDLSITELKECELSCNREKMKKFKSWIVLIIKANITFIKDYFIVFKKCICALFKAFYN